MNRLYLSLLVTLGVACGSPTTPTTDLERSGLSECPEPYGACFYDYDLPPEAQPHYFETAYSTEWYCSVRFDVGFQQQWYQEAQVFVPGAWEPGVSDCSEPSHCAATSGALTNVPADCTAAANTYCQTHVPPDSPTNGGTWVNTGCISTGRRMDGPGPVQGSCANRTNLWCYSSKCTYVADAPARADEVKDSCYDGYFDEESIVDWVADRGVGYTWPGIDTSQPGNFNTLDTTPSQCYVDCLSNTPSAGDYYCDWYGRHHIVVFNYNSLLSLGFSYADMGRDAWDRAVVLGNKSFNQFPLDSAYAAYAPTYVDCFYVNEGPWPPVEGINTIRFTSRPPGD